MFENLQFMSSFKIFDSRKTVQKLQQIFKRSLNSQKFFR